MSTPRSDYLFMFRGANWDKNLSPEELQKAMAKITAWLEELQKQGRIKGGQPLGDEGRMVSSVKHRTDGPFVETKEMVGGYLLLQAASLDEAIAIAEASPQLQYGVSIEVRPVLEECPVVARLKKTLALAAA